LPYFDKIIAADLKNGKNVIVRRAWQQLRSIVMHLEHMTKEQVLELNIPTATPLVYELDNQLKILSKKIPETKLYCIELESCGGFSFWALISCSTVEINP